MRNVLFLIAIFLISSAYGQGEIRYEHHGVARTEGDLLRAKDKFQMAVRGTKASAGSFRTLHGCLMYCPIAGGGYKYTLLVWRAIAGGGKGNDPLVPQ